MNEPLAVRLLASVGVLAIVGTFVYLAIRQGKRADERQAEGFLSPEEMRRRGWL